jgi:hypothetical protein
VRLSRRELADELRQTAVSRMRTSRDSLQRSNADGRGLSADNPYGPSDSLYVSAAVEAQTVVIDQTSE